MTTARFQIGDYVRIIRMPSVSPAVPAIMRDQLVGRVVEIDRSRLVPHYLVEFDGFRRVRFPEFDLMRIAPAVRTG